MKHLTIFLLILSPFVSVAQISKNVNNQLPDSIRPVNLDKISYHEARKILKYSTYMRFKSAEENLEIERLCSNFTPLYKHLKTNEEKLYHLMLISTFWLFRYDNNQVHPEKRMLDSSSKYTEIYRRHIQNGIKKHKSTLAKYYSSKATLLAKQKQYSGSYDFIQRALGIYRSEKDSLSICFLFNVLSVLYNELELYPQSIISCDSALKYSYVLDKKDNNSTRLYYSRVTGVLISKAYAFCSLYTTTNKEMHKDSAISNVTKIFGITNNDRPRSIAFDILARINYHQKNYANSISLIDSSLAQTKGTELNEDQINSLIFKALCLIKIGKKVEGLALIKNSKIQGTGPDAGKILEELFKAEKEKGNLKGALVYLERLQEFQNSSASSKARGEIFEIQQKYDVATKDLHILQLREEEKRNKLIAGSVGLIICFAALLLGIRFRNNQKKTRVLIGQINELTELQILRIEDGKEKERRRIGQELHDDLSGTIAAGVRYLRMMVDDEIKNENKIRLSEISDMLEKGYDMARGKSHELYLEENDGNFWKGLAQNIDLFFAATDMKVSLDRETPDLSLTPEEKTTVLLIIRESITNVIKHSKASEVEILIYSEVKKLILEINDNGKGMSSKFDSKNVGLRSINERVSRLNGTMKICAWHPAGTNLKVEIPVSEQLHSHKIHS